MEDAKFRGKRVYRNGKWEDGAATPEQLPEHMRGLPGEWLTKEEADGDRIHPLDPPHVVGALVEERVKKEQAPSKETAMGAVKKLKCAQPGENVPLSQWEIDIVRFRVIWALVQEAIKCKEANLPAPVLDIKHLRFPENNVNIYELRAGNPPADIELTKHERGFKLAVDPLVWPASIVDILKDKGIEPPDLARLTADANRRIIP